MSKNLTAILLLVVMIALIVGVDLLFLRDHFWLRLITNIAIVAAFAAVYLLVLRNR